MNVLEQLVTVGNPRGVHSRIATGLAQIARDHGVQLLLVQGTEETDCSSILDVLSRALVCGTCLTVRVQGDGAAAEKALLAAERILTAGDE